MVLILIPLELHHKEVVLLLQVLILVEEEVHLLVQSRGFRGQCRDRASSLFSLCGSAWIVQEGRILREREREREEGIHKEVKKKKHHQD